MDGYRPEAQTNEYKSSWHNSYFEWISAFANSRGGIIYVGINDDGYAVGLSDTKDLLDELPNRVASNMGIAVEVDHGELVRGGNIKYKKVPNDITEKPVNLYVRGILTNRAILDIERDPENVYDVTDDVRRLFEAAPGFVKQLRKSSKFRKRIASQIDVWERENPIYVREDGMLDYVWITVHSEPYGIPYAGKYYKRSGGTTQEIKGNALTRFLLERSRVKWDAFPAPNTKLRHSMLDYLRKRAVEKGRLSPEQAGVSDRTLLENLEMLTEDGEYTNAVAMLFGDPGKIVPGAYIKIGYFAVPGSRGMNTYDDIIYDDTIRDPLILQPDKAVEALYTKYMKALISFDGLKRIETYMIPEDAMRELLINAIAHKNYQSGNPIQIKVFDDHITIMNEGFWPFEKLNIEDVYTKEHSSYRNNPLIAEGFYRLGDIETWGRGFGKIRSACERTGTPLPEIDATDGSVTVTIRGSEKYYELLNYGSRQSIVAGEMRHRADSMADQRRNTYIHFKDVLSHKLNDREKTILLPLVEYYECKDEISSKEVGALIGRTQSTATRYLNKLINFGVIERIGDSYNIVYRLKY